MGERASGIIAHFKSMWRRGGDSNSRYISAHTISNRAPSASRSPLHTFQNGTIISRTSSLQIPAASWRRGRDLPPSSQTSCLLLRRLTSLPMPDFLSGMPSLTGRAHSLASNPRRKLAEREGFEPPVRFPAQWFSRPSPSTTRPPLPQNGAPEGIRTPDLQNRNLTFYPSELRALMAWFHYRKGDIV